jgi:hypothetical protein
MGISMVSALTSAIAGKVVNRILFRRAIHELGIIKFM